MALSSFLTEGAQIPTGSAVTDMTKQTVLPEWYTNYAMDLLSGQKAIAAQPYQTYQGPRIAGFTPDQQQGFDATKTAASAYQPGLQQAQSWMQGAQGMSGLSAAQPYLGAAAGSAADVSKYMDPYQRAVTDQIAQLGQRNLMDVLLPGVEQRYIKAGQFGGSGKMTDTMRAVRDTSSDILGKQAEYLSSGYQNAQKTALEDLQRQAGLATTAGELGGADATRQGALAQQMAGLAAQQQALGLTGAQAVTDVGAQQQKLNQSNLDVGYADFLKQQGYPQEQINAMLNTFHETATGAPTATIEQGISPASVQQQYPASTASNIASGITGAAGILKELKDAGIL
jgi:hypothetical protein